MGPTLAQRRRCTGSSSRGPANDVTFLGFEAVERDSVRRRYVERASSPPASTLADGTDATVAARRVSRPGAHRRPLGLCRSSWSMVSSTADTRSSRRWCPAASSPRASASATPCSRRRRSTSRTASSPTGSGSVQSDWLRDGDRRGHRARGPLLPLQRTPPHDRAGQGAVRAAAEACTTSCSRSNDRDDVGAAFDRAWAAGLPIPNGLGRHDNDGMFSFYVASPGRLPGRGRPRRQASSPTTGTTTAATTASARGGTSRSARLIAMTGADYDVAIVGYGPVGQRARDPARPARPLGGRARAVAGALSAAARGALRPRGRPHPAVVRHR